MQTLHLSAEYMKASQGCNASTDETASTFESEPVRGNLDQTFGPSRLPLIQKETNS